MAQAAWPNDWAGTELPGARGNRGRHRRPSSTIAELAGNTDWTADHISGLTFPLSNMVTSLSNLLVRRNEAGKLRLSGPKKWKRSGRRDVKYKTHLPAALGWFANRYTLLPIHLLQKLLRRSEKALVLYFEARPVVKTTNHV